MISEEIRAKREKKKEERSKDMSLLPMFEAGIMSRKYSESGKDNLENRPT